MSNTIVENIEHELNLAILDIKMFQGNKDSQAQNIVHNARKTLKRFKRLARQHDCDLDTSVPDAYCNTCTLVREIERVL